MCCQGNQKKKKTMLRSTHTFLRVQSHQQLGVSSTPLKGHGYGRQWTASSIKYSNKGWGVGAYHARQEKRFLPRRFGRDVSTEEKFDFSAPIGKTTKTLSPHFRPFALADGGVLFVHPSSREILTWTHEVLGKEQKASGLGNVHDESRAKIQGLIADNTIEHVSITQWRQVHIQRLLRKTIQKNRHEYANWSRSSELDVFQR